METSLRRNNKIQQSRERFNALFGFVELDDKIHVAAQHKNFQETKDTYDPGRT